MELFESDLKNLDYYRKIEGDPFLIEISTITDKGKLREINEDSYSAKIFSALENNTLSQLGLFIVCDGMGGANAGEIASHVAVKALNQYVIAQFQECSMDSFSDNIQMILDVASKYANEAVLKEAQKDKSRKGMGTTALILILDGNYAYFAHAGDSRLYLIRQQSITQLTQDHTLANEIGGQVSIIPKNIITRALGGAPQILLDLNPKTSPLKLENRDMLLLCTDGLTNELEDEEILKILDCNVNAEKALRDLVNAANQKGGKDNMTMILLKAFESKPF